MDDAEKASREWVSGRIGTMVISARLQEAFLAGAAWQREQDAKIAEGPLFNSFSGKKIAKRIRATAFDASNESKKTEVPK